jgi:pSer/pThr/pTyr-binding forkhead associated (FHA) protein
MLKCPSCGFENEDGALFCEQCKSDLTAVPIPFATAPETVPVAALVDDSVPMAAIVEESPPPAPAPEAAPQAAVLDAASPSALAGTPFPPGAAPKLLVLRGQKINMEFPIYPELNFIGRADEKPVDIDLEDQEPQDRVWCSRQHAVIHWDEAQGILTIEDLNSANGTYVNRDKIRPGQKRQLYLNDVVQIGTVHLKVKT